MRHDPPELPPVSDYDGEEIELETARELVAEAFHTFDERTARALANRLCVAFDECREAIERLRHRPH